MNLPASAVPFFLLFLFLTGCSGSHPRFAAGTPAGNETLVLEGIASYYAD
jgi:hypothetical protein